MLFDREILLTTKTSAFLFGPRMTGKTTLLRSINYDAYYDLLDTELYLEFKTHPKHFLEQVSALPTKSLVVIDEIQKIPSLLNYVQMGIDQLNHIFILSGSSARKLKRGGANLLGGRALDLRLHPLTNFELMPYFDIEAAIQYGTLPKISSLLLENETSLAVRHLKSYVSIYLKEEIQSEAIVRNVGAFNRFLEVAAQSNGQVIEFSNISRECSVPASTVKEYYQILEDTLLGFFLWPYDRNERKKARPKFYFFDCGVVRSIIGRMSDAPSSVEKGFLFETWFINELLRLRDYMQKDHDFFFWRRRDQEIDLIVSKGSNPILAIECKSGKSDVRATVIRRFNQDFPDVPLLVASLADNRAKKVGEIQVLPWREVLEVYRNLK